MSLNFHQLRCFHAVALQGSFTSAAKSLFIGQPSITTHIKSLEQKYGVELFYRYGHKVCLTATGKRLLKLTTQLFELEKSSEQLLKAAGGLLEGEIRISAFDPVQIATLASRFHSQYPNISLKVSFGNAEHLVDSLVSLNADVSFLPKLGDRRFHSISYRRVGIVLLSDKTFTRGSRGRVSIHDLEGLDMIVREKGSMQQKILDEILEASEVSVKRVLEIDSQDAVREAISTGLGVGIALDSADYIDQRLKKNAITDSHGEELYLDMEVACLRERRGAPIIREFFDFVARGA
ncbi:LysR substrate-binding domain-containing protein [Alloalcanivorax sp. C16-2]|uniref:LysR substrate-binding domain-containing protein n=1 Tax=Alloalcanivorax sp. C16-2 TaxID=3390052 RepID=UPI003970BAFF